MILYWVTEDGRRFHADVDDDCHPDGIGIGSICLVDGCKSSISMIDMEAWQGRCREGHGFELPFKFATADHSDTLAVYTPGTVTTYQGVLGAPKASG